MKTLLKLLFLSIFIFTTALAYTPNENDVKIIETAWSKVVKLVDWKSELYKSKVIIQLEKLKSKYSANERISYMLGAVIDKISYKQESWTWILYDVISVVDGDTIKIDINWKTETIRILWIDTPEKFATRTWYKECYGEEASDYAKKLLTWKKVRIEFDDTQDRNDKYWRVLAHIFLEDGSYYEELAIMSGFGFRYIYKKPTKYDNRLFKAEEDAKLGNLGVWDKCQGKRIPLKEIMDTTKNTVNSIINSSGSNASSWTNSNNTIINSGSMSIPAITTIWNYSCSIVKTTCWKMNSCEEAKFYLNSCWISKLDWNKDWTPCETLCK